MDLPEMSRLLFNALRAILLTNPFLNGHCVHCGSSAVDPSHVPPCPWYIAKEALRAIAEVKPKAEVVEGDFLEVAPEPPGRGGVS